MGTSEGCSFYGVEGSVEGRSLSIGLPQCAWRKKRPAEGLKRMREKGYRIKGGNSGHRAGGHRQPRS